MNGTTTAASRRSVQLAVLAAPSASVAEAVAEARRRQHGIPGAWASGPGLVAPRPLPSAT